MSTSEQRSPRFYTEFKGLPDEAESFFCQAAPKRCSGTALRVIDLNGRLACRDRSLHCGPKPTDFMSEALDYGTSFILLAMNSMPSGCHPHPCASHPLFFTHTPCSSPQAGGRPRFRPVFELHGRPHSLGPPWRCCDASRRGKFPALAVIPFRAD